MPKNIYSIAGWNRGKSGVGGGPKGRKLSLERRQAISRAQLGKPKPSKRGALSHFWNGGTTPLRSRLWRSYRYSQWRRRIFEQDKHICVLCGASNGNGVTVRLEADHHPVPFVYYINKLKSFPSAEWYDRALAMDELWNATGRTLCKPCHDKTKRGRITLRNQEVERREAVY